MHTTLGECIPRTEVLSAVVELDVLHRFGMPFECLLQLPRFPIVQLDGGVLAGGRQLAKVWVERDVGHRLPVPCEDVPRGVAWVPVRDRGPPPRARRTLEFLLQLAHLGLELKVLCEWRWYLPFSGGGWC